MRRKSVGPSRRIRRAVGLGILVTLLAPALVIVTALHAGGIVQGTSEAVGYPAPPTPVPPTPMPALATSTFTPVPTATTAPPATSTLLPSPTTVPPTPTMPPTATGTPAPISTVAPTATSSATATATATPAIALVKLSLVLNRTRIAQGQTMIVTVHAAARRHIALAVRYAGTAGTATVPGVAQANAQGMATFSFTVLPGPAKGASSLAATVTVQVIDPNTRGTATARFTVFPALRLTVHTREIGLARSRVLDVTVQLAVRAQVVATVAVSSTPRMVLTARGTAGGAHQLDMRFSLGPMDGATVAHVTVTVTTKDGVTDTRSLSLLLQP